MPFMPRLAISVSSRIVTVIPRSSAISRARSAIHSVVASLGGVLARVRLKAAAAAMGRLKETASRQASSSSP
jgi:hypothetical protein